MLTAKQLKIILCVICGLRYSFSCRFSVYHGDVWQCASLNYLCDTAIATAVSMDIENILLFLL